MLQTIKGKKQKYEHIEELIPRKIAFFFGISLANLTYKIRESQKNSFLIINQKVELESEKVKGESCRYWSYLAIDVLCSIY